MKFSVFGCAALFSLAAAFQALADSSPEATLDALHKAGAQADQTVFISLLAEDAVFLGVDGENRLQGQSLRDFINTSFAQGNTWDYSSSERQTHRAPDGSVVWFEETLAQGSVQRGRATGVLIRDGENWTIAQYNLTIPHGSGAFVTSGTAAPGVSSPAVAPASTETTPNEECRKIRHKTNKQAKC